MDPLVQVALISAVGAIVTAWIARPAVGTHLAVRRTQRAVAEVQSEFRNNGGSTAKDQLDRIEQSVGAVSSDLAHLRGRFDQHLTDTTLARHEGIRMWSAVEAVAQASPEGDQHG